MPSVLVLGEMMTIKPSLAHSKERALIEAVVLSEALLKSEQLVKLPHEDQDVLENALEFADAFLDFLEGKKTKAKKMNADDYWEKPIIEDDEDDEDDE
jgi:hypothetical protein